MTFSELIQAIREQFPHLSATLAPIEATRLAQMDEPRKFLVWAMHASSSTRSVSEALTAAQMDGPHDRQIDAAHIDDESRTVFLIQAKFHTSARAKDTTGDVTDFLDSVEALLNPDEFESLIRSPMPSENATILRKAHTRLIRDDYRLHAYFVTTGRFSEQNHRRIERRKRKFAASHNQAFRLIDRDGIEKIASDYAIGVISFSGDVPIRVTTEPLSHSTAGIELWSFVAPGSAAGDLVRQFGDHIFDRNIRGYLGSRRAQKVNNAMRSTLRKTPELFIVYNNGITIACEDIKYDAESSVVVVSRPQIVNGQQTTNVLHENPKHAAKSTVHVRAIRILPDSDAVGSAYESVVSSIVKATNSQTPIDLGDLRSTDRVQVGLERELAKFGITYERKRQSGRSRPRNKVQRSTLVKSVANSFEYALGQRVGTDIYADAHYERLFPSIEPKKLQVHLVQHLLAEMARKEVKRLDYPSYLALVLVFDTWCEIGDAASRRPAELIRRLGDTRDSDHTHDSIQQMHECAAEVGWNMFLRAAKDAERAGDKSLTPANFFRRQDTHDLFIEVWNRAPERIRRKHMRAKSTFLTSLG
jgi:hypothetical protein